VLHVTVDGVEHDVEGDQSVLHALQALGIDVPAACDDPRLDPLGACRLCIVRVDGRPQPVTACTTQLVPKSPSTPSSAMPVSEARAPPPIRDSSTMHTRTSTST
jgi:NADH dehydrogenase/NADH:ubiquinone oxidoreductase subunit G